MNILRNFFSTIIASVLTIILGLLIISYSITLVLFDSKSFLATLEKNNTYKSISQDILPNFLVYAMSQRFQEANPDQNIAQKISDKLDKKAFANLEPDLKNIVENSYSYAISEKDRFEVRIELKNYIPSLQQNLTSAITSLQTEGQLQGIDIGDLTTQLQEANQASIYITQDKIEVSGLKEITTENKNDSSDKPFLKQAREALIRLKQSQSILVLGAIVLLVLLFVTRIPHTLSGLKWISTTFVSASILPLIGGFLLFLIKPVGLISNFIKDQEGIANFSSAVDLLTINLQAITEKIFLNVVIISASLLGAGIILYIAVFILQKRAKHSPQSS